TILPTVSLSVPSSSGFVRSTSGGPLGEVDLGWVASLQPMLASYYEPTSLLLLLLKDVEITVSGTPQIAGFHSTFAPSSSSPPQTYAWAPYFTPGVYQTAFADVYVMSHEVAEWLSDPFVNNKVPRWIRPGANDCFSDLLEVGDPVEALADASFPVTTT